MKRALALALLLLLVSVSLGEIDDKAIGKEYAEAIREAQLATIPDGLSTREAKIYRDAFADGYYAALHPKDRENKYILNTSSQKFHKPTCSAAASIKDSNRDVFEGTRDEVIKMGYSPCGVCNP